MAKKIGMSVGILAISIITGTLLLYLVYMLPTDRIQKNVTGDLRVLQEEGNYTAFWDGVFVRMHPGEINVKTFFLNNRGMARDNFTDAIMLGNAVYADEIRGGLQKALGVYRYIDESEMPIASLQSYLNKGSGGRDISYSRYWHGYLIVLKPLLCIFTYSQIKIINVLLQGILFILLCLKMGKRINWRYSVCFVGGTLAVFPFVIPFCMQYSTATYVMLISCIIYLFHMDYWNEKGRILYYFMLIGVVTSYVDFLTYPVITLGGALVISMLAGEERIKVIIKNSVIWCVGYFGMWFGKWVAASIVLQENIIQDGFKQMLFRISSETETISKGRISSFSAVFANFSSMTNIYYVLVFLLLLVFLIVVIKNSPNYKLKYLVQQKHFLLVALYPFIWYAVIKNHSYDHSSFTYRALFVTVFALMVMIVRSCEKNGDFKGDVVNQSEQEDQYIVNDPFYRSDDDSYL